MKQISFITVIMLAALICAGCGYFKESPKVKVNIQEIELKEISFTTLVISVGIAIINENDMGIMLDNIQYDLYFGHKGKWIWLGRGNKAELEIASNEIANFTIETRIDNRQLIKIVTEDLLGAEPSEMKVDGSAWFKLGEMPLELHFTGKDINLYNRVEETGR